jgi:hypothetical protein
VAKAQAIAESKRRPPRKDRKDDDESSGNRPTRSIMMSPPLLDMKTCGIDTDSAVSASTRRSDFITLDTSQEACDSMDVRGVGGGALRCGGRGPMIIQVLTSTGTPMLLIDPEGVFMIPRNNVPEFRLMGQQRLKSFGVRLVQCFNHTDQDVLECMTSGVIIPLITHGGILVVKHTRKYI